MIRHCRITLIVFAAMSAGNTFACAEESSRIRFTTDVVPVLTKLGCNSGGCHGKATGQNGFKLSLLGFEPEFDYRAIVKESRGRRILPAAPERSLVLVKATNQKPHGGGQRTRVGSEEYKILRRWIADGVVAPAADDPVVERITMSPREQVMENRTSEALLVTAHFSDGTSRDVTRQAVYESNEPEIASVQSNGLVRTHDRTGLFSVMVRYGGSIATFHAAVPLQATGQPQSETEATLNYLEQNLTSPVEQSLIRQWRRLGITPSEPADDATFLRRVSVDICGTLPTRKEVEDYVDDTDTEKRNRLIDRLLDRPEYASNFGLKWADVLRNRGSGYATGKQRPGTALFSSWIRDSLAANKPYDQFVAEIITASGNQNENPPAIWYRQVRTQPDYVESVAQAFLGVRIQCAQCHHHPFDRWSQADYYGLAAVFSRVGRKGGFADAEVPTNEVIYLKDRGEVLHPRNGRLMRPKALGGPEFQLTRYDDPRRSLAQWMVAPDNPFFARTMVNRTWAHFHGRGIIHPIDDARDSNPPTNPELLDALAAEFVTSGYDIKHLIRVICNSYSYGLKATPNDLNGDDSQTFARFYPRRLSAEVLLDGISQVLDVPTQFAGGPGSLPPGTRAIDLPDENVPVSFLDVFGRPARTSSCECERVDAPSLAQALTLINSAEIQRKLTAETGYAAQLAANERTHVENSTDIFLRLLGREPDRMELQAGTDFLKSAEDRGEAYRSLLWSLLATNEFLFNH
ncbi:MAG: DUF1549 and DUF1553 domain-containing protein [Fuerstiella sp.]|nr:DUF1549 and DUF1553 domain-containing protein [Fuerstiella sp.]